MRYTLNTYKLDLILSEKEISQEQLSSLSNLSNVTISKIANGKSCSMDSLRKIAKSLDLEPYELLSAEKQ